MAEFSVVPDTLLDLILNFNTSTVDGLPERASSTLVRPPLNLSTYL
jgi:hypothetical protein